MSARQEQSNATAPGAPELPAVGVRVQCEGLVDAADLNGCLGKAVQADSIKPWLRNEYE